MRIAFDLDNTLIRDIFPFPLEPPPQNKILRLLLGYERLRKNTIQLMELLQQNDHEIWIYTSSLRSPVSIRMLFWLYGISLHGVVNKDIHQKHVKIPCTKYPPAFGIDVLIDDSHGIENEGKIFNFKVIRISPQNVNWYLKVKQQIQAQKYKQ
jgi:hypothetical protein